MADSLYRRVKVSAPKYADVHGTQDFVENVRYKWPAEGGAAGVDGPQNVMGQEDINREDREGHRVDNVGTARIVFSTAVPIRRFRIFYTFDTNEYNRQTPIITLPQATQFVEYFLTPVTVSAEYKFMVRVYSPSDDNDYRDSLDYWFTTQGRTGTVSTGLITLFNFGRLDIDFEKTVVESHFETSMVLDSPKKQATFAALPVANNLGPIYIQAAHTNPPIITIVSHVFQ